MLEVLVFSKRIVERTARREREASYHKMSDVQNSLPIREVPANLPQVSRRSVQDLMWNMVGIIRDRKGLSQAAAILATWLRCLPEPTDRPTYELSNLVLTGRLVAEASLLREESRGAHFRSDFPRHSPEWEKHIKFTG